MSTVIFNSDNSVQGTITSITSTPLGINLYAYNTNLSSLSTYSTLLISNTNATSTTTFNNLNSLSTNSILSINNLQATSTTTFNYLNSLSTNSILSINNLNATSTTTFNNLNSLSTNSILSINNLNATSTTTFNNLNSISTYSRLNISNLQATSTTTFNNLNSISTNSILSINNLNATSTTAFNNLNSLSTNSILSINNLNSTSTTAFNNLNSLSTNSILSINNLNATSTTTFNNMNSLSTYSSLNILNLQATSTSIFNKTNFSNLLVSNASTLLSSLNIVGNIIGSGTALTNLNYNSILNPPSLVIFNNPSTFISTLNISGNTTLNNIATLVSALNVSGNTTLNNITTLVSSLNVSGNTTLNNITTLVSSLNVSGNTTLNNITTLVSSLNISGNTTLNNITTLVSSLNVSGITTLNNITTINSSLNVSGNTTLSNNTTIFGILNVSGMSRLVNNTTLVSSLNVSGITILNNATTITSSLNVSGISTFSNKVGIGTTASTYVNLDVLGITNIHNGTRFTALNYTLNPGSLILGSTGLNYGGGTNWNGGNAAGLLMECNSNTEIVVHDNGNRLASLMYYEGDTINRITIGRNMGWDVLSSLQVGNAGRLKIGSGTTDYSLIGTLDTDVATNTRIVISGNTRPSFSGNIDYVATSTGKHLFYTTNTNQIRLTIDDNVVSTGYIYAGGATSGLRINGNDWGNTIYQNATTIGGNPANIGFTLRDNNTFNFYAFSTAGVYTNLMNMNMNGIALNKDTTITGKLNFPNTLDQYKINLWGSNNYGFGIAASTLQYSSQGNHSFYNSGNNANTFTITSMGNVSCTGSIGCVGVSASGGMRIGSNLGIQNTNPQSMLHLGNCEVVGSAPVIIFGKNTGGGNRNAFMGYTDSFFFVIGDYGNSNAGPNTLTSQLAIIYNAPASSLVIQSSGYVQMAYGYGTGSDERIKTNIKTIENALDKTLLLRGVEYNDIRIEPEIKRIGLVAQEVELIMPEVVRTDDEGLKSIEYQNLVGLLIEAIKQLNHKVTNLENIIKKNNLN